MALSQTDAKLKLIIFICMLRKKQVINSIKDLPESFSVDELFDRIILLQKIEIGLQQSDAGQTLSTQEAKKKLKKWLK